MRTRLAGMTLALLVAACAGPTTPTDGPRSTSPSAGPTPRITPSPAPAVTQRFEFDKGAVIDTSLTATNDRYINPGALIEQDGTLHLFPNSFSAWPGEMRIPHLTSSDGKGWALDAKAKVLDSKDFTLANPGMDVSAGFVTDDGTWVLLYSTVSNSAPWVIARATAPSPRGPWTIESAPVLGPGPAGAFDHGGVQWPWVVRVGDRWAMYYAGFDAPQGGTGSIGVAFSDDGVTWTRNDAPVLVATERWEGRSVDRPRVVATPGGYVLLYAGRRLTDRGLATSTDGLTWAKVPGPNIEREDFPVKEPGAWDSALLYRDGELDYFLEIGGEPGTKIYRATLAWP
jgi:predicted GH43/DUF377 family glycosyl hydrolase